MSLTNKAAIIVSAIFATLPLSACSGIENTIRNMKPVPDMNSPAVIGERIRVIQAIEAAFSALDANGAFTRDATSTHDLCYTGQNNYKVEDGYAHRCEFRTTRFYGMRGDFRAQVLGLERLLDADGWRLRSDIGKAGIGNMIEVYDSRCDRSGRIFASPVPDCSISRLPAPYGYRKNHLDLSLVFAEKQTNDLFSLDYAQKVPFGGFPYTHDRKEFHDVGAVFRQITQSHDYVLAVSVQGIYFEN